MNFVEVRGRIEMGETICVLFSNLQVTRDCITDSAAAFLMQHSHPHIA